MKSNNIRVVLASDSSQARSVLRQVVEREAGGVVIGEAENSARALVLTKNLRPDITIIDTSLPYVVGLDDVPLSRIGGLDTAQSIVERSPKTQVVLLGNLDPSVLSEHELYGAAETALTREKLDRSIPFTLHDLSEREQFDNSVVFANLGLKAHQAHGRSSDIIFGGMFIGALVMGIGWMMMIALWLIPLGFYVAAAGAALLAVSLVAKLLRPAWRRFFNRGKTEATETFGNGRWEPDSP